MKILKTENVIFKPKTLLGLIERCYPDIRNTIITLKQNVIGDKLQDSIQFSIHDDIYDKIYQAMKSVDPEAVRKVLRSNMIHYQSLFGWLYEKLMNEENIFSKEADAILLIGEHLHKDVSTSIKEINFMTMYFKMLKNGII